MCTMSMLPLIEFSINIYFTFPSKSFGVFNKNVEFRFFFSDDFYFAIFD